ncbi:hypothetical protein IFM89_000412 [Coptis chinensis]|uniref:DUF7915 domain-containing protein n=1 Tax=Coptis chinensis TaxID=261450 RepID=A0A835LYR7_9MAGN|nr:hypothetical protein IFM89_000412 [Coptis chinensis]
MSCSPVEEETVVVGTEDVVEALMDYFLDPILPSTPNKNAPSPLSLQQSVANQKLALSAVKETTGIDPKELIILESHVTYSLSEEKTTACLFIMKSKAANSDIFQVPIKDAIDRFGALYYAVSLYFLKRKYFMVPNVCIG